MNMKRPTAKNVQIHKKIIGKTEYVVTSMYEGKDTITSKIQKLIQRKIGD